MCLCNMIYKVAVNGITYYVLNDTLYIHICVRITLPVDTVPSIRRWVDVTELTAGSHSAAREHVVSRVKQS